MTDDFDERLSELRDGYADRVRDRMDDLEALAARGRDDDEAVDRIREILHRLAGSGETLGFPTVSAQCADLEDRLDAADGEPDESWFRRVESLVERLRDEFSDE